MTWIRFILWLCGIYGMYYAALIVMDLLRNKGSPDNHEAHLLTFEETVQPVRLDMASAGESPVISSGGVSLKQLFNLAREEAIEYTRPVSF